MVEPLKLPTIQRRPSLAAAGVITSPAVIPPQPVATPLRRVEVFVLTHSRKPAITPDMLRDLNIPFQVFNNPDWELPAEHPEWQTNRDARPNVREYAIRQYRAFRGHQEILRQADSAAITLVFEDDATLTPGVSKAQVLQHLRKAPNFIAQGVCDAVSFHGRNLSSFQTRYTFADRDYVELQAAPQHGWGHRFFLLPVTAAYAGRYATYNFKWHEGCLAYAIGPLGRQKWLAAGHGHGMPCDLFLANELNTLVMPHSLFHHSQQHDSLINPRSTPLD